LFVVKATLANTFFRVCLKNKGCRLTYLHFLDLIKLKLLLKLFIMFALYICMQSSERLTEQCFENKIFFSFSSVCSKSISAKHSELKTSEWWISRLILDPFFFLTLSPLGYLKTRIRWGRGSIWPPPLNPMFYVQIWQMIHH